MSAASCARLAAEGLASPYARHALLHRCFEVQADHNPAAIAVIENDDRISYAELDRYANRLARYLLSRAIGRGSRVAILLPRGINAYAALLGTLKAGAAYVPLDPDYPPDRIAYVLGDCEAAALITTAALASGCEGYNGTLVRLDTDADAIIAQPGARPWPPSAGGGPGPRELAYIIYTSGSTGRPKGVMIEHRSAAHLVAIEGELYGVRSEDRVFQGSSLTFDLSVEEIWTAFRAGATLVTAPQEVVRSGPDLARWLAEAQISVLSCVPTLLAMLEGDIPGLRLLILGGEACPEALVSRWWRPDRRMFNTYGPTEATVIATAAELKPGRPLTIGQALPGYRVHLLDDQLRPVPSGQTGEICIGGVGVARGYVNRPGETARHFVPDPYAPDNEPDARLYRTGDLGRIGNHGLIEYHGRADDQVKLRGFRIELAEIETALLCNTDVVAAACLLREDTPGAPQLVGYVVVRPGALADPEQLRVGLQDRLPAYMVPACLIALDGLPQLSSGKLDRAALPSPRAAATARHGRAPCSDNERLVLALFEELLQLPAGVDDDFFQDLGGHSLLAARAVSALRKEPRHAPVSVIDLYRNPTAGQLPRSSTGWRRRRRTRRRRRPNYSPPPHLPSRHSLPGACATRSPEQSRAWRSIRNSVFGRWPGLRPICCSSACGTAARHGRVPSSGGWPRRC